MIVAFLSAALAAPITPGKPAEIAPCHAVPSLCTVDIETQGPRILREATSRPTGKMDAYRFDARPCRLIGNMDCPRRARREILRLGEPIGDTLSRSFGL